MAAALRQQQQAIVSSSVRGGFTHLVGSHAAKLVQLVQTDRGDEPDRKQRILMDIWKQLGSINDEWVRLLCEDASDGGEFKRICSSLVHGYTESIGDYIFEGACHANRIQRLTDAEGRFYSTLHSNKTISDRSVTQRQWIQYTNALVDFVQAADKFGAKSNIALEYGADVLVAGQTLGSWLDRAILMK